jgi:repressor LexA
LAFPIIKLSVIIQKAFATVKSRREKVSRYYPLGQPQRVQWGMLQGATFAKQLRKHMGQAGLTPRELARAADIGENTVYRYLKGDRQNPGIEQIAALAHALNITADDLLGIAPPEEPKTYAVGMEPVGDFVLVPLVGAASAGAGTFAEDDIQYLHQIPKTALPAGHEDSCFLTNARGESMIDAGILDGDQLLICRTLPVNDGDIAVLNVDDEVLVKRVYRRDGHYLLISDSPDFPPREVDEASLIGVVMWTRRFLKK